MARWPGRLYTTSSNRRFGKGIAISWFLHKSKKVWFCLPDTPSLRSTPQTYTYLGRPIMQARSWASAPRADRGDRASVVLWGDEVASGWAEGPDGTNHFLYIWTRWSLLHSRACHHPERFAVEVVAGSSASTPDRDNPEAFQGEAAGREW